MPPIAQNQTQWKQRYAGKINIKTFQRKTTMGKTFPKSQQSKFSIAREIITISIKAFV